MPLKKNYPKWFNNHWAPHRPSKPTEPSPTRLETSSIAIDSFEESITADNLIELLQKIKNERPKATIFVRAQPGLDEGAYIEILAETETEQPNENYKQQLKWHQDALRRYKLDLEEYQQHKREWQELKKKWDQEEKEEHFVWLKRKYMRAVEERGETDGKNSNS